MTKRTCRTCRHVVTNDADQVSCDHPVFIASPRIIRFHDEHEYAGFQCDQHEFPDERKHAGPGEAR